MASYTCLQVRRTPAAWLTDNLLRRSRKEHPPQGMALAPLSIALALNLHSAAKQAVEPSRAVVKWRNILGSGHATPAFSPVARDRGTLSSLEGRDELKEDILMSPTLYNLQRRLGHR